IGGAGVPGRYAAAFVRTPAHGAFGGYGIVLAASPLPCDRLAHLPDENRLGARWVLLALNPTKDGFAQTGEVRGEVAYPVGDAYASLSRGVTINLRSAGIGHGAVWRGLVVQAPRTIEGKVYAVKATFAARWCGW